jgi:hypothetical protein
MVHVAISYSLIQGAGLAGDWYSLPESESGGVERVDHSLDVSLSALEVVGVQVTKFSLSAGLSPSWIAILCSS